MLDIKLIRENPDLIKKSCKERGYNININELLKLDKKWRDLKKKTDNLRAERNKVSKQINQEKKKRKDIKPLISKAKKIPDKIKQNEEKAETLKNKINEILYIIPNIQHKSVPIGDESKNKTIKTWGKIPKFSFKIKPHWQIGEELDIIDLKRASKLAGSGFYVLKGDLAKLQRALIQFMLNYHIKDGFIEINPPQLVKPEILFGTGNLPKFEDDLYKTREGLYAIPTAEAPLTNLHAGEILKEKELPKKYVAFTECYRTEAGRHGTETRGIFRLHQFEKVEMVYICKQEDSWKLLEQMTKRAEKILEKLKIPYRRIVLATEDASFASAKTYDLEVWSPYLKKYLEASSCSNCTDFQARRINTRYEEKGEIKTAHTLNGSGLALPRLIISLIENYQQKDGSIKIPAVLQKYMNNQKKIQIKKSKKKK